MRGISGDDPEGGARRGVPRRRLITARPGRHGTPTARHYDLAARSSLYGCERSGKANPGRKDAPREQDRLSGEGEMRPCAQRFGSNDATPGTGPPLAIRAQPSLPRRPALYMETIEWPPGWRKADSTRPA